MKLNEYMAERDITPEIMASMIGGVSASGVRKWTSRERIPRPEQLRRISRVTDGLVQPNDFILDEKMEAAE